MTKVVRSGMEDHYEGYKSVPDRNVTEDDLIAEAAREVYATVGQFEVPDGKVLMTAELMADIDRYLNMRQDVLAQIKAMEEVAKARKEDIDLWLASQKRVMQARIEVLEGTLLQIADNGVFPGGKKSVSLPHGVIGRRSSQPKLELTDPTAAVRFAEENGIPVNKEPYIGELKEYWQATGEVPPGCAVVKSEERPYIS